MPLAEGQLLKGRYEVQRRINVGGMGAVYAARDVSLGGEPCAIKEMHEHFLHGPPDYVSYVRKRFAEEAQALANLAHPGIPRIRDFFQLGEASYIVMDLIEGRSLDEELFLYPLVAAEAAIEVLDILDYLHGREPPVVHRDIKPANLIREKQTGRIKLVDFGVARICEGNEDQTRVGTAGFMAPEQLAGHAEPRSDLYALGVTIQALVTGLNPVLEDQSHERLLESHPGLASIVEKATARRPTDRYKDARSMRKALEAWVEGHGQDEVTISVFGASRGSDGPGVWCVQLFHERSGTEKSLTGGEPLTTLERMQLTAAVRGLQALKRGVIVTLVHNSSYLQTALRRERVWDEKENGDLWHEFVKAVMPHQIRVRYMGLGDHFHAKPSANSWPESVLEQMFPADSPASFSGPTGVISNVHSERP